MNWSEHTKVQRKEIEKQIDELQTILKLMESNENRKTPCEKAYRDAYGEFPITDSMSGGDKDYITWSAFQKGWEVSRVYHYKYFMIENSKQDEVKTLREENWYVDAKTLLKSKTLWERFYDGGWNTTACNKFCEIVEQWLNDNTTTVKEDYHTVTLKLKKGMLVNSND